ncbi:MAG: hydrogen peroxide-inducible genes activator, partial [Flavobacteriaceae bacterium]|nr:hydrogen peroxide-inducible genes activator [Flavobacteriaceae bacterium]
EVGKKIVNQARNIVNESERMQDVVDQEKGFIGGDFRLGIIPTIMPTLLPMFLKNFINKYPKVHLKIEELTTAEIIIKLNDGHLDAAIAATPLVQDKIKERVLYFEPFVGYVPKNHRLHSKKQLDRSDLDINDILLLEDGHCFRDGVINICKSLKNNAATDSFQVESGSFETLIKLSNEGFGMTLLPYLNTLDIPKEEQKKYLRYFNEPSPAREVSLLYKKSELKMQIIDSLYDIIAGIIRGAITFHDIKVISPRQ